MEQLKVIKPRNYLYEFLVLLSQLIIITIWWLLLQNLLEALMTGCISYLILAWTLRLTFQKHHRKAMKLMHIKNYSDAISAFQNSYDFFEKHPNIDKYRFITMFSSSAIPYQQMALNNIGICYLYMNENTKALDSFQKLAALNENYPYITKTIEEIQKHMDEIIDEQNA